MKLSYFALIGLCLTLAGCGNNPSNQNPGTEAGQPVQTDNPQEADAALPGGANAPSDTALHAETAKLKVEHSGEPGIVPMPTGVREYAPPDGYVDNTPDPDPSELVAVDTEPLCLNCPQVKTSIRNPGDAGVTVRLKLLVDGFGRVKFTKTKGRTDPRYVNAVLAEIPNLRFRPAMKGGKPVKSWVEFSYAF